MYSLKVNQSKKISNQQQCMEQLFGLYIKDYFSSFMTIHKMACNMFKLLIVPACFIYSSNQKQKKVLTSLEWICVQCILPADSTN